MSDGGRRKSHESYDPQRKPGTDSFARAVVRVAVGQICENEGFQVFQQSALNAFADIAIRYMLDIGRTSVASANFAGRTEPNAFDIVYGVEHLNSVVGFSGGSEVDRCLLGSGAVREILNYVDDSEEIPFPYALPHLPAPKEQCQNSSFVQNGEEPPHKHIPSWLPKFPIHQNVEDKEPTEPEHPLPNLHHGVARNGSRPLKQTHEETSIGINPFLAEPISSAVKEVSPVVLPAEVDTQMNSVTVNHVEGNQASADKSNEPDLGFEQVLSKKRSAVLFKIKSRKKIHLSFLEEDVHEQDHTFIHSNSIAIQSKKVREASEESSIKSPKEESRL